jgi:hypothetical protein
MAAATSVPKAFCGTRAVVAHAFTTAELPENNLIDAFCQWVGAVIL